VLGSPCAEADLEAEIATLRPGPITYEARRLRAQHEVATQQVRRGLLRAAQLALGAGIDVGDFDPKAADTSVGWAPALPKIQPPRSYEPPGLIGWEVDTKSYDWLKIKPNLNPSDKKENARLTDNAPALDRDNKM
jgi:hypothetical protein